MIQGIATPPSRIASCLNDLVCLQMIQSWSSLMHFLHDAPLLDVAGEREFGGKVLKADSVEYIGEFVPQVARDDVGGEQEASGCHWIVPVS